MVRISLLLFGVMFLLCVAFNFVVVDTFLNDHIASIALFLFGIIFISFSLVFDTLEKLERRIDKLEGRDEE